jgi:hypothetical protein
MGFFCWGLLDVYEDNSLPSSVPPSASKEKISLSMQKLLPASPLRGPSARLSACFKLFKQNSSAPIFASFRFSEDDDLRHCGVFDVAVVF